MRAASSVLEYVLIGETVIIFLLCLMSSDII